MWRIYKNPYVVGITIGTIIFSGLDRNFEAFACGIIGLCFLYTGWWIERKY